MRLARAHFDDGSDTFVGLLTAPPVCVDLHVGKDWAKGLTAATDPRVARMAAARRGQKRGPYRVRARAPWVWSPRIAYGVGLIATDGNLSPSGRHVSVSSAERVMLDTFLDCVDRRAKIGTVNGGYGSRGLRVQIGDVGLYRWLQSIGLTPRKSLTLGAISLPDDLLPHLLRGLLDGDGSVLDVTYDGTGKAQGRRYRTLVVRFNSASRAHVTWLRERIASRFGLSGGLGYEDGMYQLSYAKRASLRLLPLLYPDRGVPCLERKREVWARFVREGGAVIR
jgi:hypothetical protein